jgi:hypothetical protein
VVARWYGIALVALAALAVLGSTWCSRATAVDPPNATERQTTVSMKGSDR